MFRTANYIYHIKGLPVENVYLSTTLGFIANTDSEFGQDVLQCTTLADAEHCKWHILDIVNYYVNAVSNKKLTLKEARDDVAFISCEDNIFITMIIDRLYPDIDKMPNGIGCYSIDLSIELLPEEYETP